MSSVPKDSWILNCSTSIAPVDVIKKLKLCGFVNVINCCEFWREDSLKKLELPWFIKQQRLDWESHSSAWSDLYEALEDDESKSTLLNTIAFRMTGDPFFMDQYTVRLNEQYFESFLNLDKDIFVDCGGFDGDSTEIFCEKYPNYKKVFFFEPSKENLRAARERLQKFPNIDYFPFGLSDEEGRLNFDPSAGSASSIQIASEHSIEVCKLDTKINEAITFLKMDIEGWEMHALEGCTDTIKKYSPKIAIAVYHSSSDFRNIFKKIKEYQPKYKVRLRHYTQGWSETIMYFSLV
jgi:FkbM family methyltransferase